MQSLAADCCLSRHESCPGGVARCSQCGPAHAWIAVPAHLNCRPLHLAALGIGTQFVGQELTEGDHVADAPVASTNGHGEPSTVDHQPLNGDTPPLSGIATMADLPTSIPAGLQLPCAEALIVDLRPPQLSLLIGKVGLRALADKTLEPLHVALLAERARRFAQGQKAPREG